MIKKLINWLIPGTQGIINLNPEFITADKKRRDLFATYTDKIVETTNGILKGKLSGISLHPEDQGGYYDYEVLIEINNILVKRPLSRVRLYE